jgi:uncharacterized protein YfaS (alpha-2-macroglobulin family)
MPGVTETKRLGAACDGKTDPKGLLVCETTSPVSGNVIVVARGKDDAGNDSFAYQDVWVAGKDEWWFDVSDSDRIDILPERKRYEPGETAKLQVRMPFREATALVTVEREGIVDAFVTPLSGKAPVVPLPVLPSYAPNVFVSVLCVRGRVGEVLPTATVDLARPAFKLGIAEFNVGWKAHELKVAVSPGREVYKVRDKARVRVAVRRAAGGALPPSEVAVAAVDEGLLELSPNGSWDLLRAMMGRRPYEVKTSTAQMQVVGKRHFGLKALPQGGGEQATRELRLAPLLEGQGAPGRERGGGNRDPPERLPDEFPDRRRRERGRGPLRNGRGDDPHDPGCDDPVRAPPAHPGGGQVPGGRDGQERDRSAWR